MFISACLSNLVHERYREVENAKLAAFIGRDSGNDFLNAHEGDHIIKNRNHSSLRSRFIHNYLCLSIL